MSDFKVLSVAAALYLALAGHAMAQRSQIARPKPMPMDLTPRVSIGQCGDFTGHFGPIDFRSADRADVNVVEKFHLDMELRTFLAGQVVGRNRAGTSGVVGGFDYVLKAIPNHPVGLLVMEQLGRKLKSENPQNNELPLECYYVRAFTIAPDDPVVRAMYGIYLAYRGREEEAKYNLDLGDTELRGSGPIQHQIGLVNLLLKRYDKAQINALRVRRSGFALQSVEQQLKKAGKWNDAVQLADEEPAADASKASVPSASASSAATAEPANAASAAPR